MAGWDKRDENIPSSGSSKEQFPIASNAIAPQSRSPLKFFVLVFALSIPFWLIGALTGLQLFPGLPLSSLMVFCPLVAASILLYKERRAAGVIALLKRSFDHRRINPKAWYAPVVFLMPGVTAATYGLMRLAGLRPPTPQFSVLTALAMFLAFFVAAIGEELGWMGYAIDSMKKRWNALQAGILLGLVWAAWHIIPLVQADRPPEWIAWWCLFTVATRVLMVWIYNNAGYSLFAAILYHAVSNVCTVLFADYFDPRITGSIVAIAAAIVTVIWGSRTLSRHRNA